MVQQWLLHLLNVPGFLIGSALTSQARATDMAMFTFPCHALFCSVGRTSPIQAPINAGLIASFRCLLN